MLFILIVIVKKLWSITFQLCKIHKKAGKTNTVFDIKFMLILNYQKERSGEKMIISDFFNVLLSSGLTIFIIIIILAILIASYKKASPNEVLIITGGCLGKKGPYLIEEDK